MEIEIDLNKSVDENAGIYFDAAKKAKKKLEGAGKALRDTHNKLALLLQEEEKFLAEERQKQEERVIKSQRKKEWYEKFHWFFSSEGYLGVGGKDATTNELVIKKHLEKDDLVFHTDIPGSPFFVVKNGQKAGEQTRLETAQIVAAYSRAWKLGATSVDVFCVLPDQVTKEAKAGEYMSKGSFMIYGKKTYYRPGLEIAIGSHEGKIITGPKAAVVNQTPHFVLVVPGEEKKSVLAKKIKHLLNGGDLDEFIRALPGDGKIVKSSG